MSASMTAPEQLNGLERLITLASLKKEDVIATHQELRKQLQLTQDEQEKTTEARAYIAKYDDMIAAIDKKQSALETKMQEHDMAAAVFAAHVESENARLASIEYAQTEKTNQQAETDSKQALASGEILAQKNEQDRIHNEAMAAVEKLRADNLSDKDANAAEAKRLADWESELKAKVQKWQEQAAIF